MTNIMCYVIDISSEQSEAFPLGGKHIVIQPWIGKTLQE